MQKKENRIRLLILAVIIFIVSFTVATMATASAFNQNGEVQTETLTKTTYGEIELSNGDVLVTRNESGCLNMYPIKAFDVFVSQEDGKVLKLKMAKGTVEDALEKAEITLTENQAVSPAPDTEVYEDMVIKITKGAKVEITADGETKTLIAPLGSVESSLNALGYGLSKDDTVSVKRDSQIKDGMKIKIQRVTYKEVTETEKIAFDTVEKTTEELDEGKTKVQTEGVNGSKEVTKKIKYVDGKKTETKVIKETVTKKPVDKVVLKGASFGARETVSCTSAGGNTLVDSNGNTVTYSKVLSGSCTAYTACEGARTATGAAVYEGGVAVNPNIIPYGTKLYIASADGSFVYGYATAVDTGGALMSGSALVDLFYFSYNDCINFGRRNLNVYILD